MIIHTYPLNFISGITAILVIAITFYILYRPIFLKHKIKPDNKYLNFFILFMFIFASFLRIYGVLKYNSSLWDDEARTYVTVRVSSVQNVLKMQKLFLPDSGPLDLIVRHFFMRLFGDSVISYMFLSTIFSILGLFVVFKLSRRFLDRAGSSVVLAFMALNLMEIYFSMSGRNYAILTLLVPLNALLFLNALESKRKIDWFLYFVTLVLCFYTHFIALALFFVHGVYIALLGFKDWVSNKATILRFFLTISAAFVLLLPLLIDYLPRISFVISSFSVPTSYTVILLIGISMATFIIITLVSFRKIEQKKKMRLLIYCYILIGYWFSYLATHRYAVFSRYFHYLLPFVLISLLAIFSDSVRAAHRLFVKPGFLNEHQLKIILFAPTLFLLLFLYYNTVLHWGTVQDIKNGDGDWKSAASYLSKNYEDNDKIIVFDFMLSNMSIYTSVPMYCTKGAIFFNYTDICDAALMERVSDLAEVNWNSISYEKIENDASNNPSTRYWLVDPDIGSFYKFADYKEGYVDKLVSLEYVKSSSIELKNLSIDLYEK